MYPFSFRRVDSVAAAVAALAGCEDAKLLAGGQSLLPIMKQRLAAPAELIGIAPVAALSGISEAGGVIEIGAMTRHAEVAASALVRARIPALAALAGSIGDPQVRNMGTLGGALAHADPAADYPAAVLGLGAEVVTDRRRIGAAGFFRGMFETALEGDEVITAVRFPAPRAAAYAKFPNPASRYAVVGAFVCEHGDGPRVAITGAAETVFRARAIERALAGGSDPRAARGVSIDADGFNHDLHASAEYRAHLVGVMAERALAAMFGGGGARVVR